MPATRKGATAKEAREDAQATPTTQRNRRSLSRRKGSSSANPTEEMGATMAEPSKQEDRAHKTALAAEARAAKRSAEKEARNERLRKQADDDLDAANTKYGVSIPPQRLQTLDPETKFEAAQSYVCEERLGGDVQDEVQEGVYSEQGQHLLGRWNAPGEEGRGGLRVQVQQRSQRI